MEPKNYIISFRALHDHGPAWGVADKWGKDHDISFNYTLNDDWKFETQEEATLFKLTFGGTYLDVL
jgi:hypothetical protein